MRLLLLAGALALLGCEKQKFSVPDRGADAADVAHKRASAMQFFREPRSGLCFAYIYETQGYTDASTGGPAMTHVPCEAVERLLANPAEAHAK